MSYKPKTRFVANAGKGMYEILSVRERPNGELQLLHIADRNHENQDGTDTEIISEKHSIHPSDNSSGLTIKRTNPLEDGRHLTTASFINIEDGRFIFPIMGRTMNDFNAEKHSARIHPRDRVVYLPDYDTDAATMIAIFVACDLKTKLPEEKESGLVLTSADFSKFRLGVYTGFINVSSFILSVVTHVATSPQQEVINPLKPEVGGNTKSFTIESLLDFLDYVSCNMCYKLNDRLVSYFKGFGKNTHFLNTPRSFMVTKRPLVDFEEGESQFPIVFTSSLPKRDGAKGLVVSLQGEPIGKLFYNLAAEITEF